MPTAAVASAVYHRAFVKLESLSFAKRALKLAAHSALKMNKSAAIATFEVQVAMAAVAIYELV